MSYAYTDPSRETDAHALPDIEVWEDTVWETECSRGCGIFEEPENVATAAAPDCYCPFCECNSGASEATDRTAFWYAYGMPGYMWDSGPYGPFDSEEEALADAREGGAE